MLMASGYTALAVICVQSEMHINSCDWRRGGGGGGVLKLCRAVGSNFVLGRQCIEARSADPSPRSVEKIFTFIIQLSGIGSRTTFVLCKPF